MPIINTCENEKTGNLFVDRDVYKRQHLAEIPTDKPVVLFWAVGLRGYLSLRILMWCGYRNVRNLIGGYKTYSTATAPLPSPSAPAGGGSSSSSVEAATDDFPADASVSKKETLNINACGLQCPGQMCIRDSL